jgi:hypothetical protein
LHRVRPGASRTSVCYVDGGAEIEKMGFCRDFGGWQARSEVQVKCGKIIIILKSGFCFAPSDEPKIQNNIKKPQTKNRGFACAQTWLRRLRLKQRSITIYNDPDLGQDLSRIWGRICSGFGAGFVPDLGQDLSQIWGRICPGIRAGCAPDLGQDLSRILGRNCLSFGA